MSIGAAAGFASVHEPLFLKKLAAHGIDTFDPSDEARDGHGLPPTRKRPSAAE